MPADGKPAEAAGSSPESQAGKSQQYLRLPVESAKKLRWYDRPDLNNLVQQNLRDKNDLLGVNAALRQVATLVLSMFKCFHMVLTIADMPAIPCLIHTCTAPCPRDTSCAQPTAYKSTLKINMRFIWSTGAASVLCSCSLNDDYSHYPI